MIRSLFLITILICLSFSVQSQTVFDPELDQIQKEFAENATAKISGRVVWDGFDLSRTTVQIYKDQKLKKIYTGVTRLQNGNFEIAVESGEYYVVAFVDLDGSGKFDVGDGMGIFGIHDWKSADQKKQSIAIRDRQTIHGIVIPISARLQSDGKRDQIVAVQDYKISQQQTFQKTLSQIVSGINGEISLTDQSQIEKTKIFAYTDLSWKFQVGKTDLNSDGKFKLDLPPGKYYILAITDLNENDDFDAGDLIGLHGIENDQDRKITPQPIIVETGKTSAIELRITGRKLENGKVAPLDLLQSDQPKSIEIGEIKGKIRWNGHSLENGFVQVYDTPMLIESVAQVETDHDGNFDLKLPHGDYFLIANVDVDGDGKYSASDAIGAYGTPSVLLKPPTSITISADKNLKIAIEISAVYAENGQLEPIRTLEPIEMDQIFDSAITGRILFDGQNFSEGLISIADNPDFDRAIVVPFKFENTIDYEIPISPGDYFVMAIVDLNENRRADIGDGIGIYGTRRTVRGEPQRISVFAGQIAIGIDIVIGAIYTDSDGNMAEIRNAHRYEMRQRHGDPEDIFRFTRSGKEIEEWWYWSQGFGFIFEAIGLGWELFDQQIFDPKSTTETKTVTDLENQNRDLHTMIFFDYDLLIWGHAPNQILEPISVGKKISAAIDGKFIFIDENENVIFDDGDDREIILDRRQLVRSAMISHDGNYIAFTRKLRDRQRVFVHHIPSGDEIALPSTAIEMENPSWSFDDKLIAYATRGSVEADPSRTDRNIYYYNRETNQIEPIAISEFDDAEPSWSPINESVLVFSRGEGLHRQIWIAELNPETGEPIERQLTKFGGESPIWLPSGDRFVYQNNGQIWIISRDGNENYPLKNGENVVFGYRPFAVPITDPKF